MSSNNDLTPEEWEFCYKSMVDHYEQHVAFIQRENAINKANFSDVVAEKSKTIQRYREELQELHVQYDNLLKVYEASRLYCTELADQVNALKKVCEFQSEINMGMMKDLTTTAISRERVLSNLTPAQQWAERTMTSLDKTETTTVQTNPDYTEFFHDA
jgi:hypothetical protein